MNAEREAEIVGQLERAYTIIYGLLLAPNQEGILEAAFAWLEANQPSPTRAE